MRVGLGINLRSSRTAPAIADPIDPAFVPYAAFWDASDLSSMSQDTAGTTPITADGQTVGRIKDKSGNGVHLTQATAASRPVYRTAAGLHWLEFDGVDDCLIGGDKVDIGASSLAVVAGAKLDDPTHVSCVLSKGIDASGNGRWALFHNNPDLLSMIFTNEFGTNGLSQVSPDTDTAARVLRGVIQRDGTKQVYSMANRVTRAGGAISDNGTSFNISHPLIMGAFSNAGGTNGGGVYLKGRVYASGVLMMPTYDSTKVTTLEELIATKTGVTL